MEERIVVRLVLDTSGYKRGALEARRATDEVSTGAAKSTGSIDRMTGSLGKVGTAIGIAFLGGQALAFGKDVLRATTAVNESANAVQKVFGPASDTILAFGQVSAQAAGLATSEFQQMSAVTGALLTNMGLDQDEAANASVRLTQRAADLASVFNTDVGDALGAVQAGLRGETEPLRRFGVSLDEASIKAKAVEMGLVGASGEMDKNARATAALELIYEQTSKVQGDFAQTSMDLANAQRIAAAEWENAKASFGTAAAPIFAGLTTFATDTLLSFRAIGGDEIAQKSLRFSEAMDVVNEALKLGDIQEGNWTSIANGIQHIADTSVLGAGDVQALGAAAGLSVEQIEALGEEMIRQGEAMGFSEERLQELRDAFFGTDEAAGEATDGIEESADAMEEAATAAEEAAAAQRDYLNSLSESASSAVRALNSLQSLGEAHAKLAELEAAGKGDTDEFREAQLELAAQVFETEQALQDFSGGNVADSIDAIATALGISFEEAQALLEELGLLDGKTVTSVVNVNFGATGSAAAQKVIAGGGIWQSRGPNTFQEKGGPVEADRPYVVGEAGPEIFIPGQSGRILSNQDSMGRGGKAIAGGKIDLTINNPVARNVEDDTRRGLQMAGFLRGAN